MRSTAVQALTLAAVLAGTLGCQSAPRWAWWKRDQPPADTSLLARSAAPPLPSSQSTPQAVAVDGLTPAAPPSSSNLAAAGAPPATSSSTPNASPATIAGAPMAQYPTSSSWPGAETPAPGAAQPPAASAAVPPSGPYDPNSYQPSATVAATSPTVGDRSADADRYATPAADRYAGQPASASSVMDDEAADRYHTPAAVPSGDMTGGDRYGGPLAGGYSNPSVAPVAVPPVAATIAPNPTATVKRSSPPGQYRPGGTTSYTASSAATQHVEVATRPSPTSTDAPATTLPVGNSEPWTPPPANSGFDSSTWTY